MTGNRQADRNPHRFLVKDFRPAYQDLLASGELARKAEAARRELKECRACPRDCGVDRTAGRVGVCRSGARILVASAFPHHGEEAVLSGRRGSGTIFFSLCNLHCVFCQNHELSQRPDGELLDAEELAGLMLRLQEWGCHNINLVTPEHVVPQVVMAVSEAAMRGLVLPIVYNTSGYDALTSLQLLEGLVDVYMPDFKFWEPETARRLAKARDYPERARQAFREMHRQVGDLKCGADGLARRGLLVRHLVLPGHLDETESILGWLAGEISPDTYVNVMGQYRPAYRVGRVLRDGTIRYADLNRRPSLTELATAAAAARRAGLWRLDGIA
jgi:putative pyruvate formate lyase activating enzyme